MKQKIISIFLIIVLLLHINSFVFAEDTENIVNEEEETNQTLEEQAEEIEEQIEEASSQLEYVQDELSSALLKVEEYEDEILEYQAEMEELTTQLETLQATIDETKANLALIEEDYSEKEELLRQRLVAMYEAGETSYLDILLNSSNIVDFISGYYLITELVEYDNELIETVEAQKEDIEATETKLEKQETELKILKAKKEQATVILQNMITLQESQIAELTEEEQELQEAIAEYKEEQEEIEAAILAATYSGAEFNIQYTGGEMLWPVAANGTYISSDYGIRLHPIQGVLKMHTGIDIAGSGAGASVVAAADGIVTYAGWLGGYGNCVMISHGDGFVTLYGHGQEILVDLYQEVSQGDIIMLVGETGNATGPHLHFEVRVNGTCVDPLNYVTAP